MSVYSLYRRCLRSALRCPEKKQREMIMGYTRDRFREPLLPGAPTLKSLLSMGEKELEDMNYYHSIRQMKRKKLEDSERIMFGTTATVPIEIPVVTKSTHVSKTTGNNSIPTETNNNLVNESIRESVIKNPSSSESNQSIHDLDKYFLKLSNADLESMNIEKRSVTKANICKVMKFYKLAYTQSHSLAQLRQQLTQFLRIQSIIT